MYIYIYIYIHIYIHTYIHTYIYVYIYIYICQTADRRSDAHILQPCRCSAMGCSQRHDLLPARNTKVGTPQTRADSTAPTDSAALTPGRVGGRKKRPRRNWHESLVSFICQPIGCAAWAHARQLTDDQTLTFCNPGDALQCGAHSVTICSQPGIPKFALPKPGLTALHIQTALR